MIGRFNIGKMINRFRRNDNETIEIVYCNLLYYPDNSNNSLYIRQKSGEITIPNRRKNPKENNSLKSILNSYD